MLSLIVGKCKGNFFLVAKEKLMENGSSRNQPLVRPHKNKITGKCSPFFVLKGKFFPEKFVCIFLR